MKELWKEIVGPLLLGLLALGLIVGVVRVTMWFVSHVWLGVSTNI